MNDPVVPRDAAEPSSIVDVILGHARVRPSHPALIFEGGDGPLASYSYAELAEAVARVAGGLMARGLAGKRIGLLFGPGSDFVLAMLGCLAVGGVAVPFAPMGRRRERVQNLLPTILDCDPGALVIDAGMAAQYGEELQTALAEHGIPCPRFEELPGAPVGLPAVPVDADTLAVLQYTSGSTSLPKGVMITHGNVMANQAMIRASFGHDADSNFVGWAPHFHDQGLFGNILQPLYLGSTCVLTAPATFVQKPLIWLELISRYRAHTSGGPNFAFELCTEQARKRGLPDVDLSSWKVAFNGAEPIRAESVLAFAETFAAVGFDGGAFLPCFGLAECTVVAVCGRPGAGPVIRRIDARALGNGRIEEPASEATALAIVCCGPAMAGGTVLIVDPATREAVPEGQVGEVWLAGPHVGTGYWNRPDATEATFEGRLSDASGPYLRTGDLGFAGPEGFYIVGRIKDLIIVRGRNYAPSDIEQIWSELSGRAGQASAAAVQVERDGRTHVVLIAEAERSARLRGDANGEAEAQATQVRTLGLERLDLSITDLVMVAPGGIPRTTSGKVRRASARQMLLDGTLAVVSAAGPLMRALQAPADA